MHQCVGSFGCPWVFKLKSGKYKSKTENECSQPWNGQIVCSCVTFPMKFAPNSMSHGPTTEFLARSQLHYCSINNTSSVAPSHPVWDSRSHRSHWRASPTGIDPPLIDYHWVQGWERFHVQCGEHKTVTTPWRKCQVFTNNLVTRCQTSWSLLMLWGDSSKALSPLKKSFSTGEMSRFTSQACLKHLVQLWFLAAHPQVGAAG